MRKLFILMTAFILVLGLGSCGKEKNDGTSMQETVDSLKSQNVEEMKSLRQQLTDSLQNHSKQAVELRVFQMYNDVMKYLYPNEKENDNYLDQKYLSTGYKKLLDKYNADLYNHERMRWWTAHGETAYTNICFAINNVKLISKDKATANVTIFFLDYPTQSYKVTVTLVYERGNWYADDFKRPDESDRRWLSNPGN